MQVKTSLKYNDSKAGRAQMNMDFQQVLHKVEKASGTKIHSSQKLYGENFIRAYYLSEEELEKVRPFFKCQSETLNFHPLTLNQFAHVFLHRTS